MTSTAIARHELFSLDTRFGQVVRGLRWGFVGTWAIALVMWWHRDGVPFSKESILLWIGVGLAAACFGKNPVWLFWIAVDFVPFALALVLYDRLRGWSYQTGLPGWWTPQVDVDKFLFAGTDPTVWLQEHLKHADVRWYDVLATCTYLSYFFLPYVTAAALWLRGRASFYRWALRFVGLSFLCYLFFLLMPTAPPWAAARCTAAQVASHPANPRCMYLSARFTPSGGVLGPMTTHRSGAHPWIEPIVERGFGTLHIGVAKPLLTQGREWADPVAAVPSLHVAATVLFAIFMWRRAPKWVRPLLVAYPVVMTFSLVYSAEHYVADAIAGALAAVLVSWVATRIEHWREARQRPDTLDTSPAPPLENPCPPTTKPTLALLRRGQPLATPDFVLPHATTPSST